MRPFLGGSHQACALIRACTTLDLPRGAYAPAAPFSPFQHRRPAAHSRRPPPTSPTMPRSATDTGNPSRLTPRPPSRRAQGLNPRGEDDEGDDWGTVTSGRQPRGVPATPNPRPDPQGDEEERTAFMCPCCAFPCSSAALLARHLRKDKPECAAAVNRDTALAQQCVAAGALQCEDCFAWYSARGIGQHRCPARSHEQSQRSDPAPPPLSAELSQFLDTVEWGSIEVAKHGTFQPPKRVDSCWADTQRVVSELLHRATQALALGRHREADKDRERAFKYHLMSAQVVFTPAMDSVRREGSATTRDGKQTVRQTIKRRCARLLHEEGALELMWGELQDTEVEASPTIAAARRCAVTGVQLTTAQATEVRAAARAFRLAEDGNFSKSLSALQNLPMLDPRDPNVIQALKDLHPVAEPQRPFDVGELPEDVATNPAYQYACDTISVPGPRGRFIDVDTVSYALHKLKPGVAQDCFGARYECYTGLPNDLVTHMCTLILNNQLPASVREALNCGRLLGLDKGGPGPELKVRPIVVGTCIVRIAARVQCYQETPMLSDLFLKHFQYGVGVSGGVEAAYHATRLHLDAIIDGEGDAIPEETLAAACAKFDFCNAYGNAKRKGIASGLLVHSKRMVRFFLFQYGVVSARTHHPVKLHKF